MGFQDKGKQGRERWVGWQGAPLLHAQKGRHPLSAAVQALWRQW